MNPITPKYLSETTKKPSFRSRNHKIFTSYCFSSLLVCFFFCRQKQRSTIKHLVTLIKIIKPVYIRHHNLENYNCKLLRLWGLKEEGRGGGGWLDISGGFCTISRVVIYHSVFVFLVKRLQRKQLCDYERQLL